MRRKLLLIVAAIYVAGAAGWWCWDWCQQTWLNRWEAAPTGFSSQVYVDQAGQRFPLVLYRPLQVAESTPSPCPLPRSGGEGFRISPETKPGVILFLNGLGENGDDGVSQLSNNFGEQIWSLRCRFPMFVIAPQMTQDSAWTDSNSAVAQAALEMVQQVVDRCGADADRIYVTGPSSGGSGTLALADRHPGTFAALAPISTGSLSRADNLPVWSLLNDGDLRHLVEGAERSYAQRLIEGTSPQMTAYNQVGHDAWTRTYSDPALYDWFGRHSRPAVKDSSKQYKLIDLATLKKLGIEADPQERTITHRSTTPSGDLLLPQSSDSLHFQYRSAQRVPCRLTAWTLDDHVQPDQWRQAVELDLPWPESGSAQLRIGTMIGFGLPMAERAMQSSRWNDVRIERTPQLITVYLNGWKLIEQGLTEAASLTDQQPLQWGLRLDQLDEGDEQQFRFLRIERSANKRSTNPGISSVKNAVSAATFKLKTIDTTETEKSGNLHKDELPTVQNILESWQRWEQGHRAMTMAWKRVDQAPLVSWFNGECLPGPLEYEEQRLWLDGQRFQLKSVRPYVATPLRGDYVAGPVSLYLPERGQMAFLGHLNAHFQPPATPTAMCSLIRSCDGTKLLDWWQPIAQSLSRAHIKPLPEMGSDRAALLQVDEHPNDRCASLELSAALMTVRPLSCPTHPLESSQLALARDDDQLVTINIAGVDCVRLIETAQQTEHKRQWLVASHPPHQIMRYIGTAGNQGVQLDIRWNGDEKEIRPSGWRYQIFHTGGGPTQYFGEAQTVQWDGDLGLSDSGDSDLESSELVIGLNDLPQGTWVVDETSARSDSYLKQAGGQQRLVTRDELAWLPLHEELFKTQSGQVMGLIQRKIFWRQLLSGELWTANVLGLLGLLLSGWRTVRWWQSSNQMNSPPSGDGSH